MRRLDNIRIFRDTRSILNLGGYEGKNGFTALKLNREQMEEAKVFLPEEVHALDVQEAVPVVTWDEKMGVRCENMDSFSLARKEYEEFPEICSEERTDNRVLVLNLANPVHPGGGVQQGSQAQEEDLCRKSSLFVSLTGPNALPYYAYNRRFKTYLGSDGVIITPNVEIFKDEKGDLLECSVLVSVMTCAAPMIAFGLKGLTHEQYEEMVYQRICGMLKVAALLHYRVLVLGAFGCGAFYNDARLVSDLFARAMREMKIGGKPVENCFRRVDFAVLDRSNRQYNFTHFSRNFNHFYDERG